MFNRYRYENLRANEIEDLNKMMSNPLSGDNPFLIGGEQTQSRTNSNLQTKLTDRMSRTASGAPGQKMFIDKKANQPLQSRPTLKQIRVEYKKSQLKRKFSKALNEKI